MREPVGFVVFQPTEPKLCRGVGAGGDEMRCRNVLVRESAGNHTWVSRCGGALGAYLR